MGETGAVYVKDINLKTFRITGKKNNKYQAHYKISLVAS